MVFVFPGLVRGDGAMEEEMEGREGEGRMEEAA